MANTRLAQTMKMQTQFAKGISDTPTSNSFSAHPIAMLPPDRAEELEKRVKGIALGMHRHYGLDPEDLFQEGMAGICRKFRIGDTVGSMIMQARYSMREYMTKEFDELHAKREATEIWHLVRSTSRTFEQLEQCLKSLPKFEERVIRLWLDGETPTAIGRNVGHHGKVVKNAINRAAGLMAQCLGKNAHVEYLWPAINRGLPLGVYFKHGKFIARAGAGGCRYLGTFDTADEASAARRSDKGNCHG